jgi:hypothetical protein
MLQQFYIRKFISVSSTLFSFNQKQEHVLINDTIFYKTINTSSNFSESLISKTERRKKFFGYS